MYYFTEAISIHTHQHIKPFKTQRSNIEVETAVDSGGGKDDVGEVPL